MTKTLLTLILGLNFLSLFGQIADNTNKKDESNIYNQSVIQFLKYLKAEKFQISDTIFFMVDEFGLTKNLMRKIGNTRLLVVEQTETEKLVIKRNGMTLYRLFPLEFDNQEFHVSLVPCSATYNKVQTGLFFTTYGGYWINFKFDNGKFKFLRIDNNAI